MHTPTTIPPLTPRPSPAAARATERRRVDRENAARLARTYDERLQMMAKDVEHILARQDSVTPDDLALLGWTSAEIVEMSPEALNIVRARAVHHLN